MDHIKLIEKMQTFWISFHKPTSNLQKFQEQYKNQAWKTTYKGITITSIVNFHKQPNHKSFLWDNNIKPTIPKKKKSFFYDQTDSNKRFTATSVSFLSTFQHVLSSQTDQIKLKEKEKKKKKKLTERHSAKSLTQPAPTRSSPRASKAPSPSSPKSKSSSARTLTMYSIMGSSTSSARRPSTSWTTELATVIALQIQKNENPFGSLREFLGDEEETIEKLGKPLLSLQRGEWRVLDTTALWPRIGMWKLAGVGPAQYIRARRWRQMGLDWIGPFATLGIVLLYFH